MVARGFEVPGNHRAPYGRVQGGLDVLGRQLTIRSEQLFDGEVGQTSHEHGDGQAYAVGKADDAVNMLNKLLAAYPDHPQAQAMLSEINAR